MAKIFILITWILIRLVFPQIAKIHNLREIEDVCTTHIKRYNNSNIITKKRLNYYKSQGWDSSALRAEIASRREAFEHEGYKNGCTELEKKQNLSIYRRNTIIIKGL